MRPRARRGRSSRMTPFVHDNHTQMNINASGVTTAVSVGYGSVDPTWLNNVKTQFEMLKLCAVRYKFIPKHSKGQTFTDADNRVINYPRLAGIAEPNPDVVYVNSEKIIANPNHKKYSYGQGFTKYFKPKCAQDVVINGVRTTVQRPMPFISCNDISNSTTFGFLHFGQIVNEPLTGIFAPIDYTLERRFYFIGKKFNPSGYTFV